MDKTGLYFIHRSAGYMDMRKRQTEEVKRKRKLPEAELEKRKADLRKKLQRMV